MLKLSLEEILDFWDTDSAIDHTDLGNEALKLASLHSKYSRILAIENRELRSLESKYKQLYNLKFDWYMGTLNGTDMLDKLGWEPQRNVILKADIPRVIDGDKDMIKMSTLVGEQREKKDVLMSIIKEIFSRSFNIRAAIEWSKFIAGA